MAKRQNFGVEITSSRDFVNVATKLKNHKFEQGFDLSVTFNGYCHNTMVYTRSELLELQYRISCFLQEN